MYSELVSYRPLAPLLLAASLLCGCRSKAPEAAAPQPAASDSRCSCAASDTTAVPDGRPVIIAFGDSLTAGYGADPGDSYPDYLQKDLDAKAITTRWSTKASAETPPRTESIGCRTHCG